MPPKLDIYLKQSIIVYHKYLSTKFYDLEYDDVVINAVVRVLRKFGKYKRIKSKGLRKYNIVFFFFENGRGVIELPLPDAAPHKNKTDADAHEKPLDY